MATADCCSWPSCDEITAAGFCDLHFAFWMAGADPTADAPFPDTTVAAGAWRVYLASKVAVCQRRQWRDSVSGQEERIRRDRERRREYVTLNYDRERDRWRRKRHERRTLGRMPADYVRTLQELQGGRCSGCRVQFDPVI